MNDTTNELNKSETNRSLWRCIVGYGVANETDLHNQLRFAGLTLLWALAFVGATWLLKNEILQGPVVWLVAILPGVLGVGMVFVYLHMLREMDEFMRRVQLEGLAIGFGAGLVFAITYGLLEQAGAPAQWNRPIVVMMFAWGAGQLLAVRRYR